MASTTDARGVPVHIDSLVEGLVGVVRKKGKGRVYYISPFGWVGAVSEDGHQHIFYPDRFLVRGEPRPSGQRKDIPEHLKR